MVLGFCKPAGIRMALFEVRSGYRVECSGDVEFRVQGYVCGLGAQREPGERVKRSLSRFT